MKAIEVKFHGPTNTRGGRLTARVEGLPSLTIPMPQDKSGEDAFRVAAEELRDRFGWRGSLIGGSTKQGYVFVFKS